MDYLPIFVQIKDQTCLVVGGGQVALRKTETLLSAGARVRVVSPDFVPDFNTLPRQELLTLATAKYSDADLDDVHLVIAATSDRDLNQRISAAAQSRRIFVNVVDDPQLCSFISPAIVDRSPIIIAIGSAGKAPVLARLLRAKIESVIPFRYGALAGLASRYRDRVKALLPGGTARKSFWEQVFEGKIGEHVLAGKNAEAEQKLQQLLTAKDHGIQSKGEVYLVGAGPGDPELLTFKALRLMQRADVVIYDRLVSTQILSLVRRDAHKLYVGKEANHHCVPQHLINKQLIDCAQQGKRVLRLKGGDPFIFGRGGEEAQALVEAGINFQVVPGITSAAGAATYCGIPLTHRDYAHSVTFTTGHLKDGDLDIDWGTISQHQQTLVIYMGLHNLATITAQLMAHGLPAQTPVAVIRDATRDNQYVLTGNLTTIYEQVKKAGVTSPALIIVGDVVRLHAQLSSSTTAAPDTELNEQSATNSIQ